MPEVDGYELLRRARRLNTAGTSLAAIAVTAFARPEDRKRALDSGFDAYVSKPIDLSELLHLVARLAGQATASF
jgi:CheY-like chemotaxis protein